MSPICLSLCLSLSVCPLRVEWVDFMGGMYCKPSQVDSATSLSPNCLSLSLHLLSPPPPPPVPRVLSGWICGRSVLETLSSRLGDITVTQLSVSLSHCLSLTGRRGRNVQETLSSRLVIVTPFSVSLSHPHPLPPPPSPSRVEWLDAMGGMYRKPSQVDSATSL